MSGLAGPARLLRRHLAHARGATALVALLVGVLAFLVVAGPAAFTRMVATEFEQTIDEASPVARYLVADSGNPPQQAPAEDPGDSGLDPVLQDRFGAFEEQLAAIRADLPEPLRDTVGPPRWSITTGSFYLGEPSPDSDPRMAGQFIALRVDPRPDENAVLVEGTWPPINQRSVENQGAGWPEDPLGVAISEEAARRLAWPVGENRSGFLLTGIFRADDAEDAYWSLNDRMLEPYIFDDGNRRNDITATAYVDPARFTEVFHGGSETATTRAWFPLDLDDVTGDDVGRVVAQLRGLTAQTYTTPTSEGGLPKLEFDADGLPALEGALGRAEAARSVLTLAAMGPLGAALVVLYLAVRSLAARRRQAVGLLASRGASRVELRVLLAADGLIASVLPVAVSIVVARLLFGGELPLAGVLLAVLAGAVPVVMLAATRIEAAMRPARADSGVRSQSRYRWVAELLLLALAGISVYLLTSQGLASPADAAGNASTPGDVDVLVAAAPVLLAGAACVVVLRLYPLPLRAVSEWLRRRRSTIGFLGSTRALRDPSVGVAPVLAVLAGVAIAVFSAIMLATVDRGASDAARLEVGADLRFQGPVVSEQQFAQIRDVPGVIAAARIERKSPRTVASPGQTGGRTEVFLADLGELAAAQKAVPGGFPADITANAGEVVVSSELANDEGRIYYPEGNAAVAGSAGQVPAVTGGAERWVIADAGNPDLGPFFPDTILMALSEEADPGAVREAVSQVMGGAGFFVDRSRIESDLRDDAISSGLRIALVAALVAAGLAAAATVLLTLIVGAAARTRMLAILRVLGVTHRQRRWLAVWEQVPVASGAVVVGCALGLGLALLVHGVVDLGPFAGSSGQPGLALRWLQIAGLVGGFVVVMTLAVAVGLLATRRTSAAVAVRVDEE